MGSFSVFDGTATELKSSLLLQKLEQKEKGIFNVAPKQKDSTDVHCVVAFTGNIHFYLLQFDIYIYFP